MAMSPTLDARLPGDATAGPILVVRTEALFASTLPGDRPTAPPTGGS
jgi:hypothetical protein